VPSSSASAGARYRPRGQERRDRSFHLKLSAPERMVLATAADRDGLTLAAYLVTAGLDRAEHRIAPVGAVQRETLAQLIGLAGLLSQAVSRLKPDGGPGPDLEPAAGYCMRVVRHVDEAVELIRQRRLR
jgi:hypothetical protein